ncbi:MAG: 1-acyl-sn-glycerol-3-phosphate acyltransferase [Pseudomonadota bacterium]
MRASVSRFILRLCGWRLEGAKPDADRAVCLAVPHTSNWDFIWMLLAGWGLGVSFHWLGKHTLFKAPFGGIMRALGGVPVNRSAPQDLVSQVAERLREGAPLLLVIPPEGTRRRADNWKSGFYYIARQAQVPVVPTYLDYKARRTGIAPQLPTGLTKREMMDALREFYASMGGKFPERMSPIRLDNEDDD